MRRDVTLFGDMLGAAHKIQRFTENLTRDDFETNEMAQSAVMREFQVIGEAARMVTDEAKAKYTSIPWHSIAGMRNRIIHAYFNIDLDILWKTLHTDLPVLITELQKVIPLENDDTADDSPD